MQAKVSDPQSLIIETFPKVVTGPLQCFTPFQHSIPALQSTECRYPYTGVAISTVNKCVIFIYIYTLVCPKFSLALSQLHTHGPLTSTPTNKYVILSPSIGIAGQPGTSHNSV